MADKKISQLTALSAANVASATDVLAIVDTSATETKKITAKDLIDGALNGGTANGVLYLNASKVATSGSALVFDGTNLGIGRTPSGYTLDITTGGNALRMERSGVEMGGFISGSNSFWGTITNHPFLFMTNSTERARITSGGDLLVNCTTGNGKLTVRGPGTTTGYSFEAANSGGATRFLVSDNGLVQFYKSDNAESARFTSGGDFLVGTTSAVQFNTSTVTGWNVNNAGQMAMAASATTTAYFNRLTDDGTIISLRQDGVEEGTISVSGNTVSYNAFAGSHWSQLQDGSKPNILRGTVMESIKELCEWPDETNERLPKSKISDTAGSKKVYGVFMAWDNDWTATNDMYVTAVGAFICRVNGSVTVQEGDLLESNGDGTARVQADDIIRSSTIGKVTSTVKTHQYDDGSYCVPTVLYCG